MSGVGAKRARSAGRAAVAPKAGPPGRTSGGAAAAPAATKRARPAPVGRAAARSKAEERRAAALSENIELENDFSDEDLPGGAAAVDEDTAAALTREDVETADERRLRLAKEVLRKYDAASAPRGEDDEEASSEEDEAEAGAGAGRAFDAVAARLKEDALAASGAIYKPLAAAIMMLGGVQPWQAHFRRGHSVRCMTASRVVKSR